MIVTPDSIDYLDIYDNLSHVMKHVAFVKWLSVCQYTY